MRNQRYNLAFGFGQHGVRAARGFFGGRNALRAESGQALHQSERGNGLLARGGRGSLRFACAGVGCFASVSKQRGDKRCQHGFIAAPRGDVEANTRDVRVAQPLLPVRRGLAGGDGALARDPHDLLRDQIEFA